MAWHTQMARVSAMPVQGYVDLTVGIITSEHGERELMPPMLFAQRKDVVRLAKHLAKRGIIHNDSDVVTMVRRNREVSDRWPSPPPRSL